MWLSKGKVVLAAVSLSKLCVKTHGLGQGGDFRHFSVLGFFLSPGCESLHVARRTLGEFWGAYDSSGNAQAPAADALTRRQPGRRRCCGYPWPLPVLIFCRILRLQLTFCYFCSVGQCLNNHVCKYGKYLSPSEYWFLQSHLSFSHTHAHNWKLSVNTNCFKIVFLPKT